MSYNLSINRSWLLATSVRFGMALVCGLGLVVALLWLLGNRSLPTVRAAAIGVTTTHDGVVDDGNCTLREAIIAANTDTPVDQCPADGLSPDVVTLPPGTYVLTVPGVMEDGALRGDLDISDTLVIVGAGSDRTIIDAGGIDRVLDIHPGAGSVAISGVTIFNGNVITGGGGGVYAGDTHLVLTNVVVSSNTASAGAGVYVYQGSASLIGGQITGNTAWGTDTLDGGGGLYVTSGSLTLDGGQIVSNTTDKSGGGVYLYQTTATQQGGRVAGNVARGRYTSDGGGGVYVRSGSVTLNGGQLAGNRAPRGGGVYAYSGTVMLTGGLALGNVATSQGGGAYVRETGAALLVNGGQMRGNSASGNGGAVLVWQGSATLSQTQILSNSAGNGGGVYVHDGNATLAGTRVFNNAASNDGGGVGVAGGRATVSRGQVVQNTAGKSGGGIHNSGGTLTLVNTTVSGNRASKNFGGGLASTGGTSALVHTTVVNNATSSGGGGIHRAGGTVTVRDTLIAYNYKDNAPDPPEPSNCNSTLSSNGHNLEDLDLCGLETASDQRNVDPSLGPLTEDGAHVPLPGSPVIDAGACVGGITTDQLGRPRPNPITPFCDVGAYESDSTGRADLVIIKVAAPTRVAAGGDVTYTLTFSNAGPGGVVGVVITDRMPLSVTVQRITSSGVAISQTGSSPYVWQRPAMAPRERGVVTITGVLTTALPARYVLPNTATIASAVLEANDRNNVDVALVRVPNDAPVAGDDGYSVAVGSPLGVAAPGVLANDYDPNDDPLMAVLNVSPTHGALSLRPDGSFIYTPALAIVGPVTFTYYASDGDLTDLAMVTVVVTDSTDLAMSKRVDDGAPEVDDTVVYALQVTNNGPGAATGVVISDSLPGGVVYVSDDSDGAYDRGAGVWQVGSLDVYSSTTLHITVTVDPGTCLMPIVNTAVIVGSDLYDPVPGNNRASAAIMVGGYRIYLPLVVRNN